MGIQRTYLFTLLVLSSALLSCSMISERIEEKAPKKVYFRELWGYLMRGEEKDLTGNEPFTDLCSFSASVNSKGRIPGAYLPPNVYPLKNMKRMHLVITELSNGAVTRLCLNPETSAQEYLIDDILRVSERYQGVQIDFEAISQKDATRFWSFLSELKAKIGEPGILSVAVPARKRKIHSDAYDYSIISSIADRVIIMAYDQHWKTSRPGPVAAYSWCRDILLYAKTVIPGEKLIMGVPLYGRAWQEKNLNRALQYHHVHEILKSTGKNPHYDSDAGNYFEYEERVTVKVYFEDERSLFARLQLYQSESVNALSFWRIGQGPARLWDLIDVRE
jgi:spore germination protein